MRILVLCYEYPPLGGGGGRVARDVAEGLVASGHEVRVQTAALRWRSDREVLGGVEVFRTASGRRRADSCTVREMGQYVATSFAPAWRHLRTWRPHVMHAHFAMPSGVLAWALHRLTGVPYVLTAHLGDVPGGVPEQTSHLFRLLGPLARQVWRRAAAATAVSAFVQELAETAYGRSVERIVNGILLDGRPRLESLALGDPPRLLFAGRFNPQKNAPLLVEALARVADLPWKLTMIGDGPDWPATRRAIDRHGLGERITLAGWCEAATVRETMAASDLLCLPSGAEGLPLAAVEALKCGLALATTEIPGVRDVLQPGVNGLAAPAGDAEGYAAALRAILSDRALLLEMRREGWRQAVTFDLRGIVSAYEVTLATAGKGG